MTGRRFPLGSQYVEALQNTKLCFTDADLCGAKPRMTSLGQPKPISGNFASVFELTSPAGGRYAVKCFTRDVPDQARRYQAISDHLATVRHSWKVGFEYVTQGVLVQGSWFPVLKMEWVSGRSLIRWIEDRQGDPSAIGRLAECFADLTDQLADAGIAHGDLQHGNLLVATDGTLRLVDYDGMYVPGLTGMRATEMGHRNYQSPLRSDTNFGPELDRFSTWVIYLSLVALAVDPGLWARLHEPGGEYLLLDGHDFADPAASLRLPVLLQHSKPEVRELAQRVRDQLATPLPLLPELTPMATTTGAPTMSPPPAAPMPPGSPPLKTGGQLPEWMVGYLAVNPPRPVVKFAGRRPLFVVGLLVLATLLAMVLVVVTPWAPLAGCACAGGLAAAYRRRPERRGKSQAKRRHQQLMREYGASRAALTRLERDRSEFEKTVTSRKASFADQQRKLQESQQAQIARINRKTERVTNGIDRQIAQASRTRDNEVAGALRAVQEQYVRDRLARIVLGSGEVQGIGEKAVRNLAHRGIRTPADFQGIQLLAGSANYNNAIAHFVLPTGRGIRVEGIGEVKARALEAWRVAHVDRARRTQPQRLPADKAKAITDRFHGQVRGLNAQRSKALADADAEKNVVNAQTAAARTALLDDQRRANQDTATRRVEIDQQIRTVLADASPGLKMIEEAERDLASHRLITFWRFIGFALAGR